MPQYAPPQNRLGAFNDIGDNIARYIVQSKMQPLESAKAGFAEQMGMNQSDRQAMGEALRNTMGVGEYTRGGRQQEFQQGFQDRQLAEQQRVNESNIRMNDVKRLMLEAEYAKMMGKGRGGGGRPQPADQEHMDMLAVANNNPDQVDVMLDVEDQRLARNEEGLSYAEQAVVRKRIDGIRRSNALFRSYTPGSSSKYAEAEAGVGAMIPGRGQVPQQMGPVRGSTPAPMPPTSGGGVIQGMQQPFFPAAGRAISAAGRGAANFFQPSPTWAAKQRATFK